MTREYRYVLKSRFLLYLAAGWRFAGHVVEPMIEHHGNYSVLMEREVAQ